MMNAYDRLNYDRPNDDRVNDDIGAQHKIEAQESIRYEVQCRFCCDYVGGDSAEEAIWNIREHDVEHQFCGRCRVTRVTVPDAVLCDDCGNDELREATA